MKFINNKYSFLVCIKPAIILLSVEIKESNRRYWAIWLPLVKRQASLKDYLTILFVLLGWWCCFTLLCFGVCFA